METHFQKSIYCIQQTYTRSEYTNTMEKQTYDSLNLVFPTFKSIYNYIKVKVATE